MLDIFTELLDNKFNKLSYLMNFSDLVLSYLRTDFPKKPKETLKAHEEALKGAGVDCDNLEDFWEKMGVKPSG